MMPLKLHILSFDVPYPADYGGVIDVFHQIRVLYQAGVKIHLHCFDYGRGAQPMLENYCSEISYYARKTGWKAMLSVNPYIVQSRKSDELINNLLRDDSPILCEGIHTVFILKDKRFYNRKIAVRPTNIEHDYYNLLAKRELNFAKKVFFEIEALRLKKFESIFQFANHLFPISEADFDYFTRKFPNIKCTKIYPFNATDAVAIEAGLGKYAFFHGNLSVAENEEVATYLIKEIAPKTNFPIIIAGKNPSKKLLLLATKYGVEIIANPSDASMEKLLIEAQIQLMLTFQPTGFKNKLLYSAFRGRHIIANRQVLIGSGMEKLAEVANTTAEIVDSIEKYRVIVFSGLMIENRKKLIEPSHFNAVKADFILSWLNDEI